MDEFFGTTRTSILNIYEKCYGLPSDMDSGAQQQLAGKRKIKQSGRYHVVGN